MKRAAPTSALYAAASSTASQRSATTGTCTCHRTFAARAGTQRRQSAAGARPFATKTGSSVAENPSFLLGYANFTCSFSLSLFSNPHPPQHSRPASSHAPPASDAVAMFARAALRLPRTVPLRAAAPAAFPVANRSVTTDAASSSLSHKVPEVSRAVLSAVRPESSSGWAVAGIGPRCEVSSTCRRG